MIRSVHKIAKTQYARCLMGLVRVRKAGSEKRAKASALTTAIPVMTIVHV